ncbi:MAG TPA: glycosyltransferase [Desulfomonilaceae bacterium]|nr:glycosyltransferase [Desulfomonilaceae bacterium]
MKRSQVENPILVSDLDIVYVGTYVPRKCGIATFTDDLGTSIAQELGGKPYRVVALTDRVGEYDYPSEVTFEIRQNVIRDYARAAEYLNGSSAQVVSLQHEFGIFGGAAGKYLSVLLCHLKKPIITTMHTILENPLKDYREAFEDVVNCSQRIVTMSQRGARMLQEIYGVPEDKISIIHHGVHDVPFVDSNFYKEKFNVEGLTVLLTFGLLSPNKGIETALEALPEVVEKYPDTVYIVLGATHPEVKKVYGEQYRLSLERKARDLKIADHVVFHNRYVDLQELTEYISCCDIYLSPYLAKEQITSGTLAYAVGMGKAVVSTPYWYAEELLSDSRGVLVDFHDARGMAKALKDLIGDSMGRNRMRKAAYEYGRTMVWREVGRQYVEMFLQMLGERKDLEVRAVWKQKMLPLTTLPEIKLDHLISLSDDVGLLQHACFGVPDRDHGYSADDVGRGLAAIMTCYNQQKDEQIPPLMRTYVSFLRHCQTETGHFHNFMSYDRRFLDHQGSEDTLGRVLWGLGTVVRWGPKEAIRALAQNMMLKAAPRVLELEAPRAKAYAIIGMYHLLQKFEGASQFKRLVIQLADDLVSLYKENKTQDWHWFEDTMTYGNGKIPEALIRAYQVTQSEEYLDVALESLDFITKVQINGVYFELIGNEGWYPKGGEKAIFGQQPIDAGYLVEAYVAASEVTNGRKYLECARLAFEWFLGRNRLNAALYDFSDGSVADGIDSNGISANQGAESVVCYLLAVLGLSELNAQRISLETENGDICRLS